MDIKIIEPEIKTLENYYLFIENRIKHLQNRTSNCLGTGLFCVGEIDEDEFYWGNKPNKILNKLSILENPKKGMLIAWESRGFFKKYYSHLGIIIELNPILITNRDGWHGPLKYRQRLDEINNEYLFSNTKIKYLIPKKLELIIN